MKWLKNWFIPCKGNGHNPFIFSVKGVFVTVFSVILFGAGVVVVKPLLFYFSNGNFSTAAVISSVLVDLVNQDRKSESLNQLTINPLLTEAAEKKAMDMATKSYFAHVSPEGHDPWFWLDVVGYKYRAAGENLAVHFSDSEAVNDAWMASPSHRANIINSEFTEIGIGTAVGNFEGRQTVFVAQFFGLPDLSDFSSKRNDIKKITNLSSEIKNNPTSGTVVSNNINNKEEISSVKGEFDGELLSVDESPATQVLNVLDQGNKKVPLLSRFSFRFVTDPLEVFSIFVSVVAILVTVLLVITAHHHIPRRSFVHIGSGFLILISVIGTYAVVQSIYLSNGKTTEVAAVIFLSDEN